MAEKSPGKVPYGRIVKLDRMLHSGNFPPLPELAEKFGVSQRTLERDIECLRDYFGAPLVFDRTGKNYRYSDKDFRLPAILLTQEELVTLLMSERLMRQYAGTPFEPIVQQTFAHLTAMLPEQACVSVDPTTLCKAIVFEQGVPIREYVLPVFIALLDAIAKRHRTEVAYYTSQGNREEGTRFIDPYHLTNVGGEWYLIAYCTRQRAVRNYHLGRIREAYVLEISYTLPSDFDPLKHVGATLGRVAGDSREMILLRLLPAASRWVKEKMWHFTQKFDRLLDDGSVIFRMELSQEEPAREALRRWILQFGDEAEVLEPEWLRKEIRDRLARASGLYARPGEPTPPRADSLPNQKG